VYNIDPGYLLPNVVLIVSSMSPLTLTINTSDSSYILTT
jgi:hypothetical protein